MKIKNKTIFHITLVLTSVFFMIGGDACATGYAAKHDQGVD